MSHQARSNPYGMDEDCPNCPALCETRNRVVHGYGDVAADVCVVGETPGRAADRTGVPFAGDADHAPLFRLLGRVGLCEPTSDPARPAVENVYLTHLARCFHPDRPPADDEVAACEPFLDAELRSLNPELIVPVGARPLHRIAAEYTTESPDDLAIADRHATTIRGRGFELVPMIDPADQSETEADEWAAAFGDVLASDYRQTKGRRRR